MNTISGLITRCYSKGEYFLDIQEALDNLLDLSLTEEPSVYLHPVILNNNFIIEINCNSFAAIHEYRTAGMSSRGARK